MKVYVVTTDWTMGAMEGDGKTLEIFDTYAKAYERFNQIITNEKDPKHSWVGEVELDDNGNPIDKRYELDEHIECDGTQENDCWWEIYDNSDYKHFSIMLRKIVVQ